MARDSASLPERFVDAHVHFWDPEQFHYAWMTEAPALRRAYLPSDLRAAAGAHPPRELIFVQAECAPEEARAEAEWVAELASTEPMIRGLVVRAALERGADAVREELAVFRDLPSVVGVRRLIQWEPDPRFCVSAEFLAATRMLAEFDLSCDLCIFAPQMPALIELVRACPDVRFVLDHLAKPEVRAGRIDPWREDLARLAALPNILCKISGLATEADHAHWNATQLRPYLDHALSCFGAERLIFGSDWPVATLAVGYRAWLEEVAAWSAQLSVADRAGLFGGNAEKFYRLKR